MNARTGWGLLLLLGLVFPLLTDNDYHLTVMSSAYIFALATLGLNLITGYTGQFNLAHAGFMAIGAYTVGILTVDHQWPFWAAFCLSGLVPVVLGLPIGLLSLRLKGHFFAIFTMCMGYILFLGIEKWESLTHGAVGIIGIPVPEALPTPFGDVSFDSPRALYYLVLGFLTLGLWVMHRIVGSLLGRTFVAIRNGDDLAESLGINLMRNKLLAFLLSVFYAGTAGGLYAGFVRFLSPDLAGVERTFDMTMYMLIGGAGTLLGPLLGAAGRALARAVPAVPAGLPVHRVRAAADRAGHLPARRHRRLGAGPMAAPPRVAAGVCRCTGAGSTVDLGGTEGRAPCLRSRGSPSASAG